MAQKLLFLLLSLSFSGSLVIMLIFSIKQTIIERKAGIDLRTKYTACNFWHNYKKYISQPPKKQ